MRCMLSLDWNYISTSSRSGDPEDPGAQLYIPFVGQPPEVFLRAVSTILERQESEVRNQPWSRLLVQRHPKAVIFVEFANADRWDPKAFKEYMMLVLERADRAARETEQRTVEASQRSLKQRAEREAGRKRLADELRDA